ncbi:MAG: NADAR family protein [Pyrinomonadaceae bacterium]|nr:NADAR family protein [Pyrinomonadaceae bacterium]
MLPKTVVFCIAVVFLFGCQPSIPYTNSTIEKYPVVWFAPINDPNKPDWEILPQEAKAGEVILSKRNELGILSNFAATPFELYGKRYASVEGFWQMMLYPEGPDDERAKDKRVTWKYTREQVAQMTAFEAKSAGTLAEENMKTLGIDWVTFDGKRFPYRSATPGEHYKLILAAMRAKANQNPEVKRILLATGDLILKPDHHGEPNPPPEWKYYEIWMQIRKELTADKRK